jgi:L-threonylcarbamoyladenylate synthase
MIISLQIAIDKLKNGDVVAVPTETVYGLAGIITSTKALEKIFITKQRPLFDPLIVHVSSLVMAKKFTKPWTDLEVFLADHFWPGPLTFIKKKQDLVSDLITSSLPSVGIRMPKHQLMLSIIDQLQIPLAAPSANKFKATSPTCAQHVEDEFSGEVAVVDGGNCEVGIESTIIEVVSDKMILIYRPGIITRENIQAFLQTTVWKNIVIEYAESQVAPGQLKEHYRPKKPITLYLTPTHFSIPQNQSHIIPSLPTDVALAARILYSSIRDADRFEGNQNLELYFPKKYWIESNWFPIRERLEKACSKIVDLSN